MPIDERKTVKYNPGKEDNDIAFVFACPGQAESEKGRVVSGATGENLERLIKVLHKKRPKVFKYPNRYDYCITNASEKVYYKSDLENRTLPYLKEDVYTPDNIRRLVDELKGKKIIAFGKHAEKALKKAQLNYIPVELHLGFRGINKITCDIHGEVISKGDHKATEKRIHVIAKDILDRIPVWEEDKCAQV